MAGPSLGWAAGFTLSNTAQNAPFEPLLGAWNGHQWRPVPVSLGTAKAGRLDGLAARSTADAWAVGTAYGTDATVQPLIEHWDGRRWQLALVPSVGPNVALDGVTVAADGQAWAVGTPFESSGRPGALHWTGHAWVVAATPEASGDVLLDGVTAVSPDNVWAVGTVSGAAWRPYAMRWNGRRWAAVSVPSRGPASDDRGFISVTSLGGGRLAAVGTDQGSASGGALYGIWNGRSWSVGLGPLTRNSTQLNAVGYDGRHAVWAVGSIEPSQQTFAPVVQVNR
jgi:hypothetical protein